jgi:predicted lipoprotein with Yx(FWY)xxD motif
VRTSYLVLPIGALVLTVAGCGAIERPVAAQTATTRAIDPPKSRAAQAPVLRVARTAYGPALTDRRGFALYRFTHDPSAASTCYGPCAAAWPPYVVARQPSTVGPGAQPGLLGTVRRADGRLQITYDRHALYYYVGDRRPHEVLCQAVIEFGGTWNVVAPDGHAIH